MIGFSYSCYHERNEARWQFVWGTRAYGVPDIISILEKIDWSRVVRPAIKGTLTVEEEYQWDGAVLYESTTETNKLLQDIETLLNQKELLVSVEGKKLVL